MFLQHWWGTNKIYILAKAKKYLSLLLNTNMWQTFILLQKVEYSFSFVR